MGSSRRKLAEAVAADAEAAVEIAGVATKADDDEVAGAEVATADNDNSTGAVEGERCG
jgi:hypothetical protein